MTDNYTYTVTMQLGEDAEADSITRKEILDATNADGVSALGGFLEVTGDIEADSLTAAGETMRGVLNRLILILGSRGYTPISEGWTIDKAVSPPESE